MLKRLEIGLAPRFLLTSLLLPEGAAVAADYKALVVAAERVDIENLQANRYPLELHTQSQ